MKLNDNQKRNFLYVLALGLAFAFFALLKVKNLNDTAALYIGLPILVALSASVIETKTVVSTAMKILTIGLILSVPILKEGFVCIIMASPILYGVTFLIAWAIEKIINGNKSEKKAYSSLVLLFGFLSLEGTHAFTTPIREDQVVMSQIVNMTPTEFRAALAGKPTVKQYPASLFLKVFPKPAKLSGNGLEIGDKRSAYFIYKKWLFLNAHEGEAIFEVTHSDDKKITFSLDEDTSYLSHYMTWKDTTFELRPVDEENTEITVKIRYSRKLDPIWYFGPLQHYAVNLTAKTMLNALSQDKGQKA